MDDPRGNILALEQSYKSVDCNLPRHVRARSAYVGRRAVKGAREWYVVSIEC